MNTCPGCGLVLPRGARNYDRKFHASAECWALYEEVLAAEFQNAVLFGQVHQLTVDAYSVQHAGGAHPDKSVCIHFVGLYLVLEQGVTPRSVAPLLQRLARRSSWPHLEPPAEGAQLTISHVVRAGTPAQHAARVREWAAAVWQSWHEQWPVARDLAGDLGRGMR